MYGNYSKQCMVNIDESGLELEEVIYKTYAYKHENPRVRNTKKQVNRVTMALGITASGEKLRP